MIRKRVPRRFAVAIAFLLSFLTGAVVYAQSPQRQTAFVYATTFFDGLAYSSAMAPPEVDTLYLMADRLNIIAPRRTQIYYWPITNRFLADWSTLNEVVEGELEIYDGDELVLSVPLQDYVIQYDRNNPLDTLQIGVGEEALVMHEDFQARFEAYREALFAYYDAQQAYRDAVDEIVSGSEPGSVDPEDLPVPPEPIADFTLQSTDPNQAYPLSLPVGRYTIRMRSSTGIIVPDSERSLVIFDSERTGAAYSVVPRDRWTRPEDSVHPNGVIYAEPGATLYLSPSRESLFNELYYNRMLDPQDQGARQDRTRWVLHDSYPSTSLRVTGSGGSAWVVEEKSYFVQQLAGSALGYEVLEFNPDSMDRASFSGFVLELDAQNPTYQVELLDETGTPVPGSRRTIRVLNTSRGGPVYFLALLPLLVGAAVVFSRLRTVRSVDRRSAGT